MQLPMIDTIETSFDIENYGEAIENLKQQLELKKQAEKLL